MSSVEIVATHSVSSPTHSDLASVPSAAPHPPALPEDAAVARAAAAFERNGIHVLIVPDKEAARRTVLELVPAGAEVLDASSQTLAQVGLQADLQTDGRFRALRPGVMRLAKEGRTDEQRRIGAAPAYILGSVHAITEDGEALIASASGSQLAPYVYGAGKVIWVVGSQKLVPTLEAAHARLEQYVLPLEDARALKAYGFHTRINKLLLVRGEHQPGRITMVLVREPLGF